MELRNGVYKKKTKYQIHNLRNKYTRDDSFYGDIFLCEEK